MKGYSRGTLGYFRGYSMGYSRGTLRALGGVSRDASGTQTARNGSSEACLEGTLRGVPLSIPLVAP
jgi:hypothetical protein